MILFLKHKPFGNHTNFRDKAFTCFNIFAARKISGPVAQGIEQQPSKLWVIGSIPIRITSLKFIFIVKLLATCYLLKRVRYPALEWVCTPIH